MSILVIGNHYWGHAETLAEAKRNFTKQGGQLSRGYSIYEFNGDAFRGVDGLGRVYWQGMDAPELVREVKARRCA